MFEGVVQRIEISIPLRISMVVLIVASNSDEASMNLCSAVLRLPGWSQEHSSINGKYRIHESGLVNLLVIDELHILANHIDIDYEKSTGIPVESVLILSRHVSSSQTPAMTLHAIGIPGVLPYGEEGRSGGLNGTLVPPNPFFASLFRTMNKLATERKLGNEFDLTLETTHHGPY